MRPLQQIWLVSLLTFAAMVFTSYIRDEYDAWRWASGDVNYTRYQAPMKQVLLWWMGYAITRPERRTP